MEWLLIRCLDNPSLQAAGLLSAVNGGCVVRCLAGCAQQIAALGPDHADTFACCTRCRDGCVKEYDRMNEDFFWYVPAFVIGLWIAVSLLIIVMVNGGPASLLRKARRWLVPPMHTE